MDTPTRRHNFYLQVIIILIGLGVLRLWMMPVEVMPRALAQGLPDSGAQRQQQIDLANKTNDLLGRIETHLREGTLRVTIEVEGQGGRGGQTKRSAWRRGGA